MFALRAEVIPLTPNVLAVSHWERILGGAIYAASPRVDWAVARRHRPKRGVAYPGEPVAEYTLRLSH
jgi:hypothetical protein